MTFYLGLHPDPRVVHAFVWTFEARKAVCMSTGQVNTITSGEPPDVVVEGLASWRFLPLKLSPGEYYRRMARPTSDLLNDSPGVNPENSQIRESIENSRGQLVALRDQLERIFRVVHPVPTNFDTYGHDIRNLLILAATEVEAHWKGILKENGASGVNTNDYVKLLPAMKLDEYSLRLPYYPWLSPVAPFRGWSGSAPTQSLTWYDAYNAVKHDRESAFNRGTLSDAIQAVCACAILMLAQFGKSGYHRRDEISHYFVLDSTPKWEPTEVYVLSGPEVIIRPVAYPF
ncbi:MAG: hypothetical protein WB676_25440 [Bryobacteraceae bacterium]